MCKSLMASMTGAPSRKDEVIAAEKSKAARPAATPAEAKMSAAEVLMNDSGTELTTASGTDVSVRRSARRRGVPGLGL